MCSDTIVHVIANNECSFFKEVICYLLNKSDKLIISLWGTLPEPLKEELLCYQIKKRGIRSRIVREYNYIITKDNIESFLLFVKKIDFATINWGVKINEDGIVLSRSSEEISICIYEYMSINEINIFLSDLRIQAIIKKYEFIKD